MNEEGRTAEIVAAKPPHPIDVALMALADVAAEALSSSRPSRFAEVGRVTKVAQLVQRLRVSSVDDVDGEDEGDELFACGPRRRVRAYPNDGVDLNRELLMMAQGFMDNFAKIEALKAEAAKTRFSSRLELSDELHSLYELRTKILDSNHDVPAGITARIDHLISKIGEPSHAEPSNDPVVHPEPVRGHSPSGPQPANGADLGEAVPRREGRPIQAQ